MSDEAKPTPEPFACPKCGARCTGLSRLTDEPNYWDCGSWAESESDGSHFIQSTKCHIAELERENAELRQRLEAAEAERDLMDYILAGQGIFSIGGKRAVHFNVPKGWHFDRRVFPSPVDVVRAALAQKVNSEQAQQNGGGA